MNIKLPIGHRAVMQDKSMKQEKIELFGVQKVS